VLDRPATFSGSGSIILSAAEDARTIGVFAKIKWTMDEVRPRRAGQDIFRRISNDLPFERLRERSQKPALRPYALSRERHVNAAAASSAQIAAFILAPIPLLAQVDF
jgi:hypothetical protein